jgi:hypothetical protein
VAEFFPAGLVIDREHHRDVALDGSLHLPSTSQTMSKRNPKATKAVISAKDKSSSKRKPKAAKAVISAKDKSPSKRKPKAAKAVISAKNKTPDKEAENLFFFEVNQYGTITESDFKDPETNREIFDVSVDRLTTTDDIISEIEYCSALVWHFRRLASDKQDDLIRRIEFKDYHDNKQLRDMRRLAKALEDEDDGWKRWIKIEGNDGVQQFKEKIVTWLAAPVEWEEDMPDNATAQGSAMSFFNNEDPATLDRLGVWIVEGDRPGSTYYAAELKTNVKEANEIAEKLGLSYRFRKKRKTKP